MTVTADPLRLGSSAGYAGDRIHAGRWHRLDADRPRPHQTVRLGHGGGRLTTVRDLAFIRADDKGNTSNIVVVADSEAAYDRLEATLTADRIHERFAHLGAEGVTRYEVPATSALNFVIDGVLAGGVTTSLRLDSHGKSLLSLIVGMELPDTESR